MREFNDLGRMTFFSICMSLAVWARGAQAEMLPPDPDNAALLYYQAFLLCPDLDAAIAGMINNVLEGAEPNDKVSEYMENCRETIELAETAAQMRHCNWGVLFSQGFKLHLGQLGHLHRLTSLLYVSARALAANGNYQAALDRCLTIRRLARHASDDMTILHGLSLSIDGLSQCCIEDVLEIMPPNSKILTWLQAQLAAVQGASQSPARALEMDLKLALQTLSADPDTLAWLREQLAESTEDARNLTDEELVARAREPYADFLDSALRAMDSEMPYEEKYAELQRLTYELEEKFGSDPAASQIIMACAEQVTQLYDAQLRHIARSNALKAAIEIYLATAKTGQLPKAFLDYLPKDPYSGQNFEYKISDEGFSLRCRVKAINEHEVRQYDFKVSAD
ncbi:MAG: hypothetical protein ACYSWO_27445 [Planctomycetota bacterium]